jgi:hypothetical protein
MLNSSSGGAQIGQLQAQGLAQETLQGQQYYTNALNNLLNERTNYYGTAVQGGLDAIQANQAQQGLQISNAQNQAQDALTASGINSAQNLALAGYSYETPQLQNQYNLNTTQLANNFNQGNYQTQAGIYGNQLQADTAAANTTAGYLGKGGGTSPLGAVAGLKTATGAGGVGGGSLGAAALGK